MVRLQKKAGKRFRLLVAGSVEEHGRYERWFIGLLCVWLHVQDRSRLCKLRVVVNVIATAAAGVMSVNRCRQLTSAACEPATTLSDIFPCRFNNAVPDNWDLLEEHIGCALLMDPESLERIPTRGLN